MNRLFFVLLLSASFSAHARAEAVLLLPTMGDDALQQERRLANDALDQAMRHAQLTVIKFEAIRNKLGAKLSACRDSKCTATLLQAAQTQSVVQGALYPAGAGKLKLGVMIIRADGARFPWDQIVDADALASSVANAFLEARSLQHLGRGPWLELTGEPAGAEVLVDGEKVGTLPLKAAVGGGRHELQVTADGHAASTQTIDVPKDDTKLLTLRIVLGSLPDEPTAAQTAAASQAQSAPPSALQDTEPGSRKRSKWNYVAGGVLAAAAVGLIAYGAAAIASDGSCQHRDVKGRCAETLNSKANQVWPFVAAAGAGLGAGVMFIVAPIAGPRATSSASLQMRIIF